MADFLEGVDPATATHGRPWAESMARHYLKRASSMVAATPADWRGALTPVTRRIVVAVAKILNEDAVDKGVSIE